MRKTVTTIILLLLVSTASPEGYSSTTLLPKEVVATKQEKRWSAEEIGKGALAIFAVLAVIVFYNTTINK